MATQEIDDLLIRVDATTELLRRELKKAEGQTTRSVRGMERTTRKLDKRFDSVGKSARRMAGVLGVAFGGASIATLSEFARRQVEVADRIGKAAIVAGVTTDQIQELRVAFSELAGTQDREVDESLRRFNRRLGEARRGNQAYLDTYRQLNIELRDSNGFRSSSVVLEDVIEELGKLKNEALRASVASVLFGEDAGPKLAAALGKGKKAVDEVRNQLRRDGGLIPTEAIKSAEEITDRIDQLNRVITAEQAKVVLDNANAYLKMAVAFAKLKSAAIGVGAFFTDLFGDAFDMGVEAELLKLEGRLSSVQNKIVALGSIDSLDEKGLQRLLDLRNDELELLKRIREIKGIRDADNSGKVNVVGGQSEEDRPKQILPLPPPADILDENRRKLDEAAAFFQSTRTEIEQIEAQIARVQELAAEGFFDASGVDDQEILDRLNKQLEEVKRKTSDTSKEIAEVFAVNVGGAFDEMFTNGQLNAHNFAESIIRDLLRITTQLFVMKPLIEGLFGASGGSGAFGQALFAAFGFNKGGSFTVGGRPGVDRNFVPLALTKGERVDITPAGKARSGGGVNVVVNEAPGVQTRVSQTTGPNGDQTIVLDQIERMVENKVNRDVSNGTGVARALEDRYGLQR